MIEPTDSLTTAVPTQRRLLGIGAAAGLGLLLALGAVVTMAASPSPSPTTAPGTTTNPGSGPGWFGGPGFGGRGHGPLGGPGDWHAGVGFGDITITAINGSSVSLKTADGWTRTITVGTSTTITKGGQTITLSDLSVGDQIHLRETRDSSGTFTVTAIDVVVPQEAGTVSATTADGFTLKTRDGTTVTVTVTSATTYTLADRNGSTSASKSDIKAGVEVVVTGTPGSNDTFTAATVRIEPAEVAGQVTAKTGDTITVSGPGGTTATIHVGSGTTYQVAGKTDASLSDITTGMFVSASGTKRADGSLDATSVTATNGHGRMFRGGPWGPHDSASPAPNTSQS